MRITAQLIDAVSGTHLWADRFDGSLEDVFDLQEKVAISVAGVIEPTLQVAEMRRSAARSTADLTAYDLYLRALAAFYPNTRSGFSRLLICSKMRSRSIRITGLHSPGRRSVTCGLRLKAGPRNRSKLARKPAFLLGKRLWLKRTTPESSRPPL